MWEGPAGCGNTRRDTEYQVGETPSHTREAHDAFGSPILPGTSRDSEPFAHGPRAALPERPMGSMVRPLRVFRSLLFWSHLVAGVAAAVIIIVMSVTGVALTYQRQMQYWADTRHFRTEPSAGEMPLAPENLIATVESQLSTDAPAKVTNVTWRADADLPVAVAVGNKTYYANPYTGHVYGEGTGQSMRAFFSSMVGWHRWLAMTGDQRTTGRAITGAANLLFLFIVISGLYLWWPRSLTWTQLRQITWFRGGLSSKARDFNWHNTLGFWSAIPLALVVYSGVVISYPWASNGVYRMMGEEPPARTQSAAPSTPREIPEPPATDTPVALSALATTARLHTADWNILSMRLPAGPDAPAVFTIDRGDGGQPHKRATLTLSQSTGLVESYAPFSDQSPGRQLRSILRFAHTGEAGGLTGQTIAGLVSAFSVVLVYTGLALSWRRLVAWIRRRRGGSLPDKQKVQRAA